jgi:hypothetical protein
MWIGGIHDDLQPWQASKDFNHLNSSPVPLLLDFLLGLPFYFSSSSRGATTDDLDDAHRETFLKDVAYDRKH